MGAERAGGKRGGRGGACPAVPRRPRVLFARERGQRGAGSESGGGGAGKRGGGGRKGGWGMSRVRVSCSRVNGGRGGPKKGAHLSRAPFVLKRGRGAKVEGVPSCASPPRSCVN